VSDIFQEIDEELRRENFAKLWQRYGHYVIGLAILIVVLSGAVVGWRGYQRTQREAEGERYALGLDLARQGKDKDAVDIFSALARQAGGGHAVLARFEEGALKARSGDSAGAVAMYDLLAADGSIDPAYRDLATLLAAQCQLKDGDPKAVIERLVPLAASPGAWHPTALELTALAQLKEGDKAAALATYRRIADDREAPPGLRERATEILDRMRGSLANADAPQDALQGQR
jgi:hypothetical protein